MDITEFEKTMRPNRKRSQMDPYASQIFELREKGYANWQIREFLTHNGVKVSTEAVRQFVNSRESHAAKRFVPEISQERFDITNQIPSTGLLRSPLEQDPRKKANRYSTGGLGDKPIGRQEITDFNQTPRIEFFRTSAYLLISQQFSSSELQANLSINSPQVSMEFANRKVVRYPHQKSDAEPAHTIYHRWRQRCPSVDCCITSHFSKLRPQKIA